MKKMTRLFMIIAVMILSVSAFAQKPFAGNITFENTAIGTDDPNFLSALSEQTQEYIVMGNNWRINANYGFDLIQIFNGNTKTLSIVLDLPGYGKYYVKKTAEELDKARANTKMDYEYTNETKSIAGYNCKKVVVKATDLETDEESTVTLWVTEELGLGDEINYAQYPGLKGYPLSTEAKTEYDGTEITVITTATKVTPNKKVKPTEFLLPSDAKDLKDAPEDLNELKKQLLEEDE